MTELTAKSYNRDNHGSDCRDSSDNSRIERDRLTALLSAETTFVVYHPTFISQIKACWLLFKTAFRLKKRDGFVVIGRTSVSKEMTAGNKPTTV